MSTVIELLEKADALKDELDNLRPIQTDRMARVMQKLLFDWNYHSNSMEGNTLTLTETRAFILYGITAKGKPFRDYIEMRGHNEALKKLEQVVHKDLRLTERIIKDFHKTILVEPFQDELVEINPGQYKKFGNYLYSPQLERIDFEPPEEVPRLINELVNWTNNHLFPEELSRKGKRKYDFHPVLVACYFHLRFIRIHSFGDGNGRMGRILMNLILMIKGYMPVVVRLENREEYYSVLNQSDTNNIEPLAVFILKNLIESLELTIKGAKGKAIEDLDDWQKELSLLQLAMEQKKSLRSVKKSPQLIWKLYEISFIRIFIHFFEKMFSFAPFFEHIQNYTLINGECLTDDAGLNYLDKFLYENLDIQSIGAVTIGDNQELNLTGTNLFRLDISIEFHDYFYKIKANGLSIEKPYIELLTGEEIDSLIQAVGKLGLEKIKNVVH